MRQYEVMYVLKPDLEDDDLTQLMEKFNNIITGRNGEITELNRWGKRRLAYEIKDYKEGHYVVLKCRAEHAAAQELDRVFRITDGLLRHMIIRKDQ